MNGRGSSVKVCKAILHTKGLESRYTGEITPEEIAVYQRIFAMMDGQEAIVVDAGEEYHFAGLTNETVGKELCYTMEQDPFMGCYVDQRAEFDEVYDAGDYSPDGIFCLPRSAVEIIAEEGK